jgi:hypothetical protein
MTAGDRAVNADTIASSSYYILLLVVLVSAFAVRRLPIKRTLAMILGWVAIFAVGFVLVSIKDDVSDMFVGRAGGPRWPTVARCAFPFPRTGISGSTRGSTVRRYG